MKKTITFLFIASFMFSQKIEQNIEQNNEEEHETEEITLEGVKIEANINRKVLSISKDRETPTAISVIEKPDIKNKTGNQSFPNILKNTPSVYISNGIGYGETEMILRGFDQSNTAFLINGQPINAMDKGNINWADWSNLEDIASYVEIQRGLGSSRLAISSVGGTVNIVTKATEKEESSLARFISGNDGYWKAVYEYNSGLKNKIGASFLISTWRGDGYNRGNKGNGQSYFFSLGYKPNQNHDINFMIYGSPQQHDNNLYSKISDYKKYGYKYNPNQGFLNGKELVSSTNSTHKPVLNINWDWNINENNNLSTVVYASIGSRGKVEHFGNAINKIPGSRNDDGRINWNNIVDYNQQNAEGIGTSKTSHILNNAMSKHTWYGIVSNYNHKFSKKLQLNLGVDGRSYQGKQYGEAYDLLGLSGYKEQNIITNTYRIDPWRILFQNADRNQRNTYNEKLDIQYLGSFGQLEYADNNFSAYAQGAISQAWFQRTDYFNYSKGNQKSKTLEKTGYNIKGGLNYKINKNHDFFVNSGYYSRQPFSRNLFLNYKNDINPIANNEKIFGMEAGYQFNSQYLILNFNAYRTTWEDRTVTIPLYGQNINGIMYGQVNENRSEINEIHQGIEIDFLVRPAQIINFKGHFSLGNWKYSGNAVSKLYDIRDVTTVLKESSLLLEDVKTSNAPQLSYGIGIILKPIRNFSFDADLNRYEKLYSDFDVSKVKAGEKIDLVKLPNYFTLDLGINYNFIFDTSTLNFRFNVNNALNDVFITYSKDNIQTQNGVETFKGINVNNRVYLGNGRTWNIGATYQF